MDEKYINQSLSKYLDDLAAKKPAPGGGSVGALAGALASGLVSMAVNFSVGKEPQNEKKLRTILKQSEKLRKKMSALIDKDVEAYKKVSVLFKSSKAKSEAKQKALKNAAKVPLEIAQGGLEIIKLNKELFPLCNPRLISDIAVSLSLAYSSIEIGTINVEENLARLLQSGQAIIKDKRFNKTCKTKLANLKKISRNIKNELFNKI